MRQEVAHKISNQQPPPPPTASQTLDACLKGHAPVFTFLEHVLSDGIRPGSHHFDPAESQRVLDEGVVEALCGVLPLGLGFRPRQNSW